MEMAFSGQAIEWRGPAPHVFVPLPEEESDTIEAMKSMLTYGWGVIPVTARVGDTEFRTSLFPKDGVFLLPLKVAVRRAEGIDVGDEVEVRMFLDA
jgi:uncharacterized protein DUF1905